MAIWDRTYNTPSFGAAYTVTIVCPAGWRPKVATRPNLTATQVGNIPLESYEILYEKAGASPQTNDVWKIGTRMNNGGSPRNPTVYVKHTSTPPPTSTIAQDKPTICDGAGGGAGMGSGFGHLELELKGVKGIDKIRLLMNEVTVFPLVDPKDDKKKGKAVKGRGKKGDK